MLERSLQNYKTNSTYTVLVLEKSEHVGELPRVTAILDHIDPKQAEKVLKLGNPKIREVDRKMPIPSLNYQLSPLEANSAIESKVPAKLKIFNATEIATPRRTKVVYDKYKKQPRAKSMGLFIAVASIAMVFGALFAGKMVKKSSLLSAFFNTESIDDELQYDIAYTTIASDMDYGSFYAPSINWTGDLEKFDV